MQRSSQLPVSTPFRGFVGPLPVTGSENAKAFLQLPAGIGEKEAGKQEVLLFDLLQQALSRVDFMLQCKCIAFDIQLAMDERVLAETSSFVLLLETLVGMTAENAPTGACITIAAERISTQVVIVVKEESFRTGESAAERLISWFTGSKPRPAFNPAKMATAQRITGQHSGKMTVDATHKARLIVQIPVG